MRVLQQWPHFLFVCTAIIIASLESQAQITLESCQQRARENYPLIRQRDLIHKAKEYSIQNASKGYIPTVALNAQETYQSDVVRLPEEPGQDSSFPVLSKDQYRIYGDVVATLYDGGAIHQQKQMHEANAKIDEQSLEVELYELRQKINQLYFGILMLDGQLAQHALLQNDLELGLRKTNAAIANGTVLKSSGNILQAELLKTHQTAIELHASRLSYIKMLELMIGQPLNENVILERPAPAQLSQDINRPELQSFAYQSNAIDIQRKILNTQVRPKLSAFFQGGYGKPGLNVLNTEAESFYITGLKLNWNLTGFYTRNHDKELLEIKRSTLDVRRETFLFNNNYQTRQQSAEISKLEQLASTDDEIIVLRSSIKETAAVQLENGVIDTNDYLHEVNSENQARQTKVLHEIQLLFAQYNLQTTTGI
ncbi:MAG TPA: TolC family protein [Chryseolinea sp.]|nr:TolC family protein [Chryseolinea sp.]